MGIKNFCVEHKRTILLAGEIGGSLTATVMAFVEAPKIKQSIKETKAYISEKKEAGEPLKKRQIAWKYTKAVGPKAALVIVPEGISIACAIANEKDHTAKLAAATEVAQFLREDKQFYKEAVKDLVGEDKEKEIEAKAVEKKEEAKADKSVEFFQGAPGSSLHIYEPLSNSYICTTTRDLKDREKETFQSIFGGMCPYITVDEWLIDIGVGRERISDMACLAELGWNINSGFEIDIEYCELPNGNEGARIIYRVDPMVHPQHLESHPVW